MHDEPSVKPWGKTIRVVLWAVMSFVAWLIAIKVSP